ncbi:MAG: MinD/ParA family protein [Lachnospiraceae bacterium]|nr:MinD/ParA family protein [Lachnospiraceae bacterium]
MDQAEQLRNMIRANNQPENTIRVDNQPRKPLARVITVTSGKGGVGKSNLSINLAVQLRKLGQRVVILDADFGLANIEIMFGTIPKHNLSDLIYQGKSMKEIVTQGPMDIGFVSGGSGITGLSNLTKEELTQIVRNLAELDAIADTVIVDTGAGISDAVMEFLLASEEILLVTTPEPTSITDSYSLLKVLGKNTRYSPDATKIRMVANKVQQKGDGKILYRKLNAVVLKYLKVRMEYLGEVPEDYQLSRAVMQQKPVSMESPGAKAALAYEQIAARLMNKEIQEVTVRRGMSAFFSHIFQGKGSR